MFKKIIALLTVFCILFSVMSLNVTSNAVYYQNEAKTGDVDGNGVVDLEDAIIVLKIASGTEDLSNYPLVENADIDGNGEITIFDARTILRCSAGLVSLQPTGAFYGFEGNAYADLSDENAEKAIEVFNYYLNSIKNPETEKLNAGFNKYETQALYLPDGIKIGSVEIIGINLGASVGTITNMVTEKISESDADRVETHVSKGESCYNKLSVEGQTYVSQLTADDVCGIRFNIDYNTMIATIEVALYDTIMEKADEKGYNKVLDTERMIAASTGALSKIFNSGTTDPVMTREFRNCILKAEISLENNESKIISYTVSYDEYAYIYEGITSLGSFSTGKTKLKDVEFKRYHIIEYKNFQW